MLYTVSPYRGFKSLPFRFFFSLDLEQFDSVCVGNQSPELSRLCSRVELNNLFEYQTHFASRTAC